LLALLVGAVLLLAAGWWWQRERTALPPSVPFEGVEPQVALAIERETEKVRQQPRSGVAWGRLGQVLRAHGFDEQAVACWAQAERFDKREPRWPYYRGVVLLMLGEGPGLDRLRRAVALADAVDADNLCPRLTLAEQLLAHAADANEVEEVLRVVAQKAPNNARLRFCQAALAERRGDTSGAIRLFLRLRRHPCAQQKVSARLAALYGRLRQPEESAVYAEMAARLPEDARWPDPYWAALTNLEMGRQGRYRELKRHEGEKNDTAVYEQLLDMVKGEEADDKAHLALALTLLRLGKRDEAERPLRQALALEPKSVRALYNLAAVLFLRAEEQREAGGDSRRWAALYEEAIRLLRRVIELKPHDAYAHMVLGRALLAQGRLEAAIEALRVPPVTRPEDFRSHLCLAEALLEAGQWAEARQHLERAGQLAPKEAPDLVKARQRLAEKTKKGGKR
jgi:tetratricopeptide (TPR) repeat protein